MTSQVDILAGSQRPADKLQRREVNLFSILASDCSDGQLAHLVAQQQALTEEAQSERHDRTNNPGKGVGNSYIKIRLLNIVLSGEMSVAASSARQLTLQSQRTAASPSVYGSLDANPWLQTHGNSAKAKS
jgi:hypothetical protein